RSRYANASGSWPTPTVHDGGRGGIVSRALHSERRNLQDFVLLTSWPSPVRQDGRSSARHGYMKTGHVGTTLFDAARLVPWATPSARDYRTANLKSYRARGGATNGEQLPNQVVHSGPVPP